MTTSTPVTVASKKANIALEQVLYLNYPLCFQKNITDVRALITSSNKVNVITPAYIDKLGFKICCINIKAQKIDSSTF